MVFLCHRAPTVPYVKDFSVFISTNSQLCQNKGTLWWFSPSPPTAQAIIYSSIFWGRLYNANLPSVRSSHSSRRTANTTFRALWYVSCKYWVFSYVEDGTKLGHNKLRYIQMYHSSWHNFQPRINRLNFVAQFFTV